jgi:hypothetical protein
MAGKPTSCCVEETSVPSSRRGNRLGGGAVPSVTHLSKATSSARKPYKTVNGVRSSLDIVGRKGGYGVAIPVPDNTWHSLRIDFKANRFTASFNGKQLFEVEDSTFPDAGRIGLWTEADSVTLFDQMIYGEKNQGVNR